MPTTLDRWIEKSPLDDRIKVTTEEYSSLMRGGSITRNEEEITLEDGPFKIVAPEDIVERGGPGSGHHGHRGRPGEVGGSLPSGVSGLRFFYRPRDGSRIVEVDSLEEAVREGMQPGIYTKGSGRIEVKTDNGELWFSVSYPFEDADERNFTMDEIDIEREIEIMVDGYNYFIDLMTDPANAKAFAAGDYNGQDMLEFTTKFKEDYEKLMASDALESTKRRFGAGMNIVMVNDRDRAGAGSSSVGSRTAKIFWVPATLDAEKQILNDEYGAFVLSPIFVQMHELHHGFGSGSEFDVFSHAIAADYYLNNRDILTPDIERSMIREVSGSMRSGAQRAAGDLKMPRLYNRAMMGWLYSRHSDYFDTLFDERRSYETGEVEDISPEGYQFVIWQDLDGVQKKVRQWANEFGT